MLPENANFAAHFGLLTNLFVLAKRKLGNHGKPMHLISKAFLIFPFFTPSLRIRSNQHADMITLTSSSLSCRGVRDHLYPLWRRLFGEYK